MNIRVELKLALPQRSMADRMIDYNVKIHYAGKKQVEKVLNLSKRTALNLKNAVSHELARISPIKQYVT